MSEVRNIKLKDTLLMLAKAFNLLTVGIDIHDIHFQFKFFHDVNSPVFKLKEYTEALQIMASDSVIENHSDKLIGSAGSQQNISRSKFLQSFLKWNRLINSESDESKFVECYKSFENFFHSKNLTSVDTCRLFNFECDAEEIQLSDSLKIRKINQAEVEQRQKELKSGGGFRQHYENLFQSNYVMEMTREITKIVKRADVEYGLEEDQKEMQLLEKDAQSVNITFDSVVKTLRLLKPSSVYRDHQITQRYDGYFAGFGATTWSPFLENTVVGAKCTLGASDVAELKVLWQKVEKTKANEAVGIALDRLSYATERRTIADRILDNFIGLESLYLPDGNHELTFRLSLRVGMMTQESLAGMKETFSFVKDMYKVRSKIVHGDTVSIGSTELDQLEKLLRDSIKLCLKDNTKFEEQSLNEVFFKRPSVEA